MITIAIRPTRFLPALCVALLLFFGGTPLYGQEVTDLVLVNADTDADIRSLSDGDVIDLSQQPTTNFSVRAVTDPSSVGSVRFEFAGQSNYQTENVVPYALNGDSGGDYDPAPELGQVGAYTITATPYTESDGGGTAGTARSIDITVQSGTSSGCTADGTDPPVVKGEKRRWHPLTVAIDGPCAGEGASPNPFLDYRLTVTFTHNATGTTVEVPGYFAADGDAANTGATSGTTWHAHLTPRRTGTWSFETSFRNGTDIAVSLDPNAGTPTSYDEQTGTFTVSATNKSGRDHRGKGILQYESGERYLRFDDGTYFLKAGADSPENLLAYSEFDGTTNNGGSNYLRDYSPHVGDWNAGDPAWDGGRGKGLIGALNYLASEEMTAFSFLTMNVNGDGNDVWPWTTPSSTLRFDVSKLAQWNVVFSHADSLGLFKHFKTQETENDRYLNDGDLGRERKLYYRELVARFGHHHALNWNLGEEYDVYREKNDGNQDRLKGYADYIRALDPYDHPIVVHTYPGGKDDVYSGLTGFQNFTGPSIQLGGMNDQSANQSVRKWLDASAQDGKLWNVSIDEPGTAGAGLQPDANDNHDAAREVLWGTLLAGGDGLEWYFGYQYANDDLDADDWRSRDQFWDYHRYALDFLRSLPFRTMDADNARLGGEDGYVFSDGLDRFVVYLTDGGTGATLDLPSGTFEVEWFDPRNGGSLQAGGMTEVNGGSNTAIGSPPNDQNADWIALVKRAGTPIPVEMSAIQAVSDGPRAAEVRWTTESETNNAGFYVLHRGPTADGFSRLGFVEGAGTTAERQSYAYRATELAPGTHTFRLRQVDVDGAASLSRTVSVDVAPEAAFSLSPPSPSLVRTQTKLTLTTRTAQHVDVALYDVVGRRIRQLYQGTVSPQGPVTVHVSAERLPPGVYFVRATGQTGSVVRRVTVLR